MDKLKNVTVSVDIRVRCGDWGTEKLACAEFSETGTLDRDGILRLLGNLEKEAGQRVRARLVEVDFGMQEEGGGRVPPPDPGA